MPFAVLTSHSTLLTDSGWVETSAAGVVAAIGVDRYGRLSICDVGVTVFKELAVDNFLGTRAAFGAFHPETTLVHGSGERTTAESICRSEGVQSFKWESCVHGGELMASLLGTELLWDSLRAMALTGNEESIMIKSFRVGVTGKNRFVRLHRVKLEEDYRNTGFEGAAKWIQFLLATETDAACADRHAYRMALWLATCRSASGQGYRLSFDSHQHTCVVKVEKAPPPGQLEPLRTAFASGSSNRARIDWADRSWSPVSSGFLLDGRTS